MIWPSNYNRYAAATMFSLFFAGNTYAPDLRIEGEPVQDWLQGHYIAAFRHCFRRLKNCAAIAGWGTMNEPHPGLLGCGDLALAENPMIPTGPSPSPFQTMIAASGRPVKVPVYGLGIRGRRITGYETLNPQGLTLFREGFSCPWKQAGVWTDAGGEPRLLRKDHFAGFEGRPVQFTGDFLKPFMGRFIEKMREPNEGAFFFIEGAPSAGSPAWEQTDPPNAINAFHWYDGITLFTRSFRPWFNVRVDTARPILGRRGVAAYYRDVLGKEIAWTREKMGDMPCLLGEFGLPFDMNGKKAFKTGDYRVHEEALSLYYDAVDANLLHSTIWNYTADNTNQAGDGWNDEDLSIFSLDAGGGEGRDCGEGRNCGGGRARGGWLRPYPMATAGTPLSLQWDRKKGIFTYRWRAESAITAPTEIFIPAEWFPRPPLVSLETAAPENRDKLRPEYQSGVQRLFVHNGGYDGELTLIVKRG
jgi:hypothetical protein